jgi:pimeloyl-ACP methyl ester carboxylesterase
MRSRNRVYRSIARFAFAGLALRLGGCAPASEPSAAPVVTLERHVVDSDGHAMAVWEKSPERAEAKVLLLHGRTWSAVPDFDLQVPGEDLSLMDGLNDTGIGTYGLDARGYGDTQRDETGWLTPDRAARDVINVLEWIRSQDATAPPPILFGWSYGSMVAQLAVQRRPDLVSGVVLFGYPDDPTRTHPVESYPTTPPRALTTAQAAGSDFIVEGAISQLAIDSYVAAALVADPIRVDWKDLHQWNELDPRNVTVPTLLIEGEHDPITDTGAHAALFARLATSDRTWTVIPGGDHAAFLETPRGIFLEALETFVHRVTP